MGRLVFPTKKACRVAELLGRNKYTIRGSHLRLIGSSNVRRRESASCSGPYTTKNSYEAIGFAVDGRPRDVVLPEMCDICDCSGCPLAASRPIFMDWGLFFARGRMPIGLSLPECSALFAFRSRLLLSLIPVSKAESRMECIQC